MDIMEDIRVNEWIMDVLRMYYYAPRCAAPHLQASQPGVDQLLGHLLRRLAAHVDDNRVKLLRLQVAVKPLHQLVDHLGVETVGGRRQGGGGVDGAQGLMANAAGRAREGEKVCVCV